MRSQCNTVTVHVTYHTVNECVLKCNVAQKFTETSTRPILEKKPAKMLYVCNVVSMFAKVTGTVRDNLV